MRPGQLLMQYPIALPADYDMQIIKTRVRTRGSALDDREGLGLKAYCIREGAVNEYAPFYLWTDSGAAAEFLWGAGPGFDGIVRDFGRPVVHTWVPAAIGVGGRDRSEVAHAWRRTETIDPAADLAEVAAALRDRVAERAARAETHVAVAGIDPRTWSTVEFTTLAGDPPPGVISYTVPHISQP
jgi:uncharacterized protein DUF4865